MAPSMILKIVNSFIPFAAIVGLIGCFCGDLESSNLDSYSKSQIH
uniref:Uncharacterized protein n=1 Tax=Lepeophtheirus salmonis TaxID=72036 RepID=A0A0K2T715_LEPSM